MRKTILTIALLLPMGFLSAQQEESAAGHYERVLDNEYVRVSRLDFDTKLLRDSDRELPHPGIAIGPTAVIVFEQFTKTEWSELGSNHLTYKFVDASYAEGGQKLSRNMHDFPGPVFREIKLEFKALPPASPFEKDAVKLDPKHNEVLFENERVRVVRIHFGLGESGPVVDKRPRVIILLTDTHAQVTLPDGHSEVREGTAGTIQWSKGGRQATMNGILGPLENIVVELKSAEPKGK
jgi:hypothetical protein